MNSTDATISINARSGVPFYRQIIDRILLRIAAGDLKSGDRLPTVRQYLRRAERDAQRIRGLLHHRQTAVAVKPNSQRPGTGSTRNHGDCGVQASLPGFDGEPQRVLGAGVKHTEGQRRGIGRLAGAWPNITEVGRDKTILRHHR